MAVISDGMLKSWFKEFPNWIQKKKKNGRSTLKLYK